MEAKTATIEIQNLATGHRRSIGPAMTFEEASEHMDILKATLKAFGHPDHVTMNWTFDNLNWIADAYVPELED
jgi:hypothetical protein